MQLGLPLSLRHLIYKKCKLRARSFFGRLGCLLCHVPTQKHLWPNLKNRLLENQKTEASIRFNVLNKFTQLGMPDFQ